MIFFLYMCVCCSSFGKKVSVTFLKTCPRELLEGLHLNPFRTRISINLIHKGLPEHLDNVVPNQPDAYKCVPDIPVSVHLSEPEDSVFL